MPIFKSILKKVLWVSLILALGQIPIGDKSLGKHFIEGVGRSFVWSGNQALTTKWLAGMDHPEWLDTLFEVNRKEIRKEKNAPLNMEHLTEKEREQVRKILQ